MKIKFKYLFVLIVLSALSCGPKKGIVTKKKNSTKKEVVVKEREGKDTNKSSEVAKTKPSKALSAVEIYIDQYSDIAQDNMRNHKIPASITLAQGILESGSGRGRLATKANNHFGIKCHGWKGSKIYHDDDRSQECFRKYRKAETSYKDHSEFLTGRKRYASLFRLKPNDYKGWAKGLRAAGYATDRKYPQKLISLIERYQLYKYDEEVLGAKPRKTSVIEKGTKVKHVVAKGDTLYSISRLYKTTVEAIKDKNNLTSNDLSIGQELIISN
ncbi:glucosaminidase domain-containing protein [Winogradskyella echinorum]|uniref:Peptidoglycan hydrolase n=1 Tax=Winogradskyella echinorum TaxID=538189 RepID=A0ABR6Y5I7_9FLAO|nr:glucosaminidase domain-containing protein [Winogradskyella echinorum]MBC3847518.1 glucosaminidase domain-containing protein [Winogradskyella echinorum]MBC5751866.1 glucosaminidase domain-containing protein [Winogradskyella echinorum]